MRRLTRSSVPKTGLVTRNVYKKNIRFDISGSCHTAPWKYIFIRENNIHADFQKTKNPSQYRPSELGGLKNITRLC